MAGAARWIEPGWPALGSVRAAFSLRQPGHSAAPWDSLNLGTHVGDDSQHVARNRQALATALDLPAQPPWLEQVHGQRVVSVTEADNDRRADAIWSDQPGQVCAVMVADCLPLLLRDDSGRYVAAVHAGWRGLAGGVIQATLATLAQHAPQAQWQAWLGPCIGPQAFEVGDEVRAAFCRKWPQAGECFVPSPSPSPSSSSQSSQRWLADLQGLAAQLLQRQGISQIWRERACTYSHPQQFFSYRRDGQCGRMAALIWRQH